MGRDERYARQLAVWGAEKQARLAAGTVLVAGVGGLGATVAQLLARAGVGRLIVVDDGTVAWPDLNRQLLYDEWDIGRKKVLVAAERLSEINAALEIIPLDRRIDDDFVMPAGIDCVADCLDTFASRFALYRQTPAGTFYVHGGIQGEHGQVLALRTGTSQPLEAIFAGARQPEGAIPVTPDGPAVIAGIMSRELFGCLWGSPALLDRVLVVDLAGFHCSFLDV